MSRPRPPRSESRTSSLTPSERESLGVYRYLLTNPNSDPDVFRSEMADLKALAAALGASRGKKGKDALIFPGHGEYY